MGSLHSKIPGKWDFPIFCLMKLFPSRSLTSRDFIQRLQQNLGNAESATFLAPKHREKHGLLPLQARTGDRGQGIPSPLDLGYSQSRHSKAFQRRILRTLRDHQEPENPGIGKEQARLSTAVLGIFSRGIFEVQSPRISGSWNSSRCRGNARRSFSDQFQPRVWEFLPAAALPGSCRHPLP